MPAAAIDIFISYSRTETAFVDRLERDLNQAGYTTWVDRHQLPGSQNWRGELQDAIDHARIILVVLTPVAIASINVQTEWNYALNENKPIIPLLYQGRKIPMELSLAQSVNFVPAYPAGLQDLLQALRARGIAPRHQRRTRPKQLCQRYHHL